MFTNDESLEEYQGLVGAFAEARANMDTSTNQASQDVAEVIWQAATDGSDVLRYVSDQGAKASLNMRYSYDQDEAYVAAQMKDYGL